MLNAVEPKLPSRSANLKPAKFLKSQNKMADCISKLVSRSNDELHELLSEKRTTAPRNQGR